MPATKSPRVQPVVKKATAISTPPGNTASSAKKVKTAPAIQPKASGSSKVKATSRTKAKAAFANFSLSRHTEKKPAGYVEPGADPQATHRQMMTAALASLPPAENATRQLNLALAPATLKKLIPSYVAKRGTASVSDVLSALATYTRGTTFTLQGNATLRRLALQSQVDQIMKEIQGGAK